MEKIVSLCKRRGFVFPSSEIYGGFNGFWDYGPYGSRMKRAIEKDSTPSATLYRHYADIVDKLNMPDEAKKYREKAKKLEMDSYQEIPDDMKVKIE